MHSHNPYEHVPSKEERTTPDLRKVRMWNKKKQYNLWSSLFLCIVGYRSRSRRVPVPGMIFLDSSYATVIPSLLLSLSLSPSLVLFLCTMYSQHWVTTILQLLQFRKYSRAYKMVVFSLFLFSLIFFCFAIPCSHFSVYFFNNHPHAAFAGVTNAFLKPRQ